MDGWVRWGGAGGMGREGLVLNGMREMNLDPAALSGWRFRES